MIYDYLIIGKGLIGSAAARYLSDSGKKVALTGPNEINALKEKVVFGSHYDQSRIQRILGEDSTWSLLNLQSVRQYPFLEKESGISFHSKEGCLYVNPYGEDSYLRTAKEQREDYLPPHRFYDTDEALRHAFSAYHFPAGSKGMLELSPSGHVNPRRLIEAQLTLARKNGADIFNDTVTDLIYENGIQKIGALNGTTYQAKKVLLAPGAFVNFFSLLKNKLRLKLKSESTIWATVDPMEAAHYSSLPSLLYRMNEEDLQDIYLVKPLLYPNGDYIVKMGGNLPYDIFFDSLKEVQQWFLSERPLSLLQPLLEGLKKIMPQLPIIDAALKNCIISYTAHGKPYIGQVDENLFVATGGNGYAAMCSDALGNIAAGLLLENKFPDGYSAEEFRPLFAGESLPF